jgi:choline dehydrogenase-like flavoprotein
MVYSRGHRADYDQWAASGAKGWSYADVLPAYRKSENFEGGASEFHGVGGELNVAEERTLNPLTEAFVEAAAQTQLRRNDDFNGAEQDGVGPFQVTQKNGERWSSARAFLHPVLNRLNLTVLENTLTRRIDFEGKRAVGVTVARDGQAQALRARREVILSAGAVASPHLLMLSGVGEAAQLKAHGIPEVLDLPGVGRNLQDHQDIPVIAEGRTGHSFGLSLRALPWMIAAPFQYLFARRGPLTTTTVEAGAFARSSPEQERPDLELIFAPLLKNQLDKLMPFGHGYTIHVQVLRPRSRGQLVLASADPTAKPRLEPNFMSAEEDLRAMASGIRLARRILAAPAFARYGGGELAPGPEIQTDEQLAAHIRANVATGFHPAGTCKMGDGPDAVVDEKLRVRGLEGLRVADASIMPTIVAGHTTAPAIMIGERASSFILEEAEAASAAKAA